MIKMILEREGVDYVITNEHLASVLPMFGPIGLSGMRLMVAPETRGGNLRSAARRTRAGRLTAAQLVFQICHHCLCGLVPSLYFVSGKLATSTRSASSRRSVRPSLS